MPDRVTLLKNFENHKPIDAKEKTDLAAMIAFLQEGGDCFARTHLPGHFTGSALLINRTGDKVLLNHHKSLNFWMQFGGHADGDSDLFAVARREVQEESGFMEIAPVVDGILDIDIHGIPYNAKKAEPAHLHYDVRYLFRLTNDNDNFTVSDESLAMRWCGFEEAVALTGPGSVARMLSKWKNL